MPTDLRDAVFNEINAVAAEDRNVILLTGDQGAFGLDEFKKSMPDQYFNVGIAEQNLINLAAGLALSGKRPVVYAITPFLIYRAFEQIKLHISGMNLPILIIGSGAGYTYDLEGPTHHAIQDIALMRTLPGMVIYNPADSETCAAVTRAALESYAPTYIRIDKGTYPRLSKAVRFEKGFRLIDVNSNGSPDVMLISTGIMVNQAMEVAHQIAADGLKVSVVDLYRIKPIDRLGLLNAINHGKLLVTMEENSIVGGIGSLIAELLEDTGSDRSLLRIALPDENFHENGNRAWLHEAHGLDTETIVQSILAHRS